MLIACNSLIGQPALERRATDWIRWLVEGEAYTESQSYGEMLLLTAIHFHAGQLSAVADLVCQTTGIKMTVRTNGMARIKQIFTTEIFTESVVAAHAVKVPVTPRLSSAHTGFLPVHCIHQLLKSRVFSKHRVSIKSWIYRQILSSASPLHPVLPPLVEVFVTSILLPSSSRSNQHEHLNEPLSEAEVRSVFAPPHFSLDSAGHVSSSGYTAQLCILYYILLYEDTRLSGAGRPGPGRPAPLRYSAELLAELPLKFLLGRAESRQGQLEGLYPSILRLCVAHFPHLCLVEDWLRPAPLVPATLAARGGAVQEEELGRALAGAAACPAAANIQLGRVLALPARLAWQHALTLVSNGYSVLEPGVPRHTQELWRQVWLRLNTVYPRQLWLLTVNQLTPPPAISQEDLALDPLAVLRCDERVFRCGPLLSVVLYMLKACLAASRSRLAQHLQDQPPPGAAAGLAEAEREELKNSLVLTQESAAIQILLETCQPGAGEQGQPGRLAAIQEIRSLVCCYLHQAFIEDTNLAKLVHFQGYPHQLLPMTAQGVPSMFICLNTAPELLSQPSLDKQVVVLSSDLQARLSRCSPWILSPTSPWFAPCLTRSRSPGWP
jgi:integrator complex subunit 2